VHGRVPDQEGTRDERKRRTRQALLDAALELLEDHGFSGLSLRQVTRAAGVVPTAFYRHFEDMEQLGLALIDESFRTLRAVLRAARTDGGGGGDVIRRSVAMLVRHVHEHESHYRFIGRERFGGVAALRHAIRREIRLLASELAIDLARFPQLDIWSNQDLQLLAGLMVDAMITTAEDVLDSPGDPASEAEIVATAEARLRMIMLGVPHWRSRGGNGGA
jgi:AcrR family transcriptional regulator